MPPVADTFRTVTLAEIDVTIEQAIGDAKMLGAICFLSVKTGETNVMRGGEDSYYSRHLSCSQHRNTTSRMCCILCIIKAFNAL